MKRIAKHHLIQVPHEQRRGSITVLMAFVLLAMLGLAGFLLSLSYIELTRTELQAATDASARSAVIQLVVSQSEAGGAAAAKQVAQRYRVAGRAFDIDLTDVTFGHAQEGEDGKFAFEAGGSPSNAAQVNGRKTTTAPAGSVPLPFGHFIGQTEFEVSLPSTAMRLDFDLVLVLDRSGSMAWDLSSDRFVYPLTQIDRPLLENYFSPPEPNDSRWAVLSSSVEQFLDTLEAREVSAQVGLVTFASDYEFGNFSSEEVTLNHDLTTDFAALSSAVYAIGDTPVIGDTNISAGLLEAESLLTTSAFARVRTAQPTIVLFSDGIFTAGANPVVTAAALHANHGIVIHSVTFGAEIEAREMMDEVAAVAGNGLSLHADSAEELLESFQNIANSLPVLVTE